VPFTYSLKTAYSDECIDGVYKGNEIQKTTGATRCSAVQSNVSRRASAQKCTEIHRLARGGAKPAE